MLYFWTFNSLKNPEKLWFSQNIEQHNSFQHWNKKCCLSSKSAYFNNLGGSCDAEDWSNDAENSAAYHRNK